MLRHYISSTTGECIKSEKLAVKMGYTTSQPLPDVVLAKNEYFAMLDANGKVQYWPDDTNCTWQVKTRFEKVTAYSKETQASKLFDDKTLVTDEFTLTEPPHQYVIWDETQADWQNDIEKRRTAKNAEIKAWRDNQENSSDLIVTVDGIDWNADPAARDRIINAKSSSFQQPFWTDAHNVDQTEFDLQKIFDAFVVRGSEIHQRKREMNEYIEACTAFDEIDQFVVGWTQ